MINFYNYHSGILDGNEMCQDIEQLRTSGIEIGYTYTRIEHIIKKEPPYAFYYARDIIKGRWIEAEPYIMKGTYFAYWYAKMIIKGRWLEAEPYIMKIATIATWYATGIIKGRWIEAESYIKKDLFQWVQYVEVFGL